MKGAVCAVSEAETDRHNVVANSTATHRAPLPMPCVESAVIPRQPVELSPDEPCYVLSCLTCPAQRHGLVEHVVICVRCLMVCEAPLVLFVYSRR